MIRVFSSKFSLGSISFDRDCLGDTFSDLKTKRVVGIGECCHFTNEFSRLRQFLIQNLVEDYGFNTIALECSQRQAERLTDWLNNSDSGANLSQYAGPLTIALYGAILTWLKIFRLTSPHPINLVGIDLPNTLDPEEDADELSAILCRLDPETLPKLERIRSTLNSIKGESAVPSSAAWRELPIQQRDAAIATISGILMRLNALSPIFRGQDTEDLFNRSREHAFRLSFTLETLQGMVALFEGRAVSGETSIRDLYMATSVNDLLEKDENARVMLLAHNNHIQKSRVSFTGELTAIPLGLHLANRPDYCAIGMTHLGETAPEMEFNTKASVVGFSVNKCRVSNIMAGSIEKLLNQHPNAASAALILELPTPERLNFIRSQSTNMHLDSQRAFDAVLCTPRLTKDRKFLEF